MKNSRMMMAEAIQEAVRECKSNTQLNSLKYMVASTNESTLIDAFISVVSRISPARSFTVGSYVTKIVEYMASEVIYNDIVNKLNEKELVYFNGIIKNQNEQFCAMLDRCNKGKTHTTRLNLLALIMRIDASKLSGRSKLKTMLSGKAKETLVATTTKHCLAIRRLVNTILDKYNDQAHAFEYVSEMRIGSEASLNIIGVKFVKRHENYMLKKADTILDTEVKIDLTSNSSVADAIEDTLNQKHTFDEDMNNAVMSIIDTPLFDKILGGNSTDAQSIEMKVAQARHDIKEGLDFWNEIGKGNVYFKYIVDFRGRISQIGGISAVGNKVGKAMLRAGNKVALGRFGYDDLLIALAGAMGYDKETFNVRLKWAKENVQTYVTIGNTLLHNPEAAFTALMKLGADDAFEAATYSLELYRISQYHGDIKAYESNVYAGYDATSSAVQLVGLLMGNEVLTEASNTRKGPNTEDKIHDAYMLVAKSMDNAAKKMEVVEGDESIKMWLSFDDKIKRAFAKPLMMTRLYGSTFLTHMDSAEEVAVSKGILDASDNNRVHAFALGIARLFNYAFNNEEGFNCLRAYEGFVKGISKAYSQTDKHVSWAIQDATDSKNQTVTSIYNKYKGQWYSTYVDGKKHTIRTYKLDIISNCAGELILKEEIELDSRRSMSAIAPNFIHSHDALVLHSTVNKMKVPMRLTHDCFATALGNVRKMQDAINETYVELFGDNNLHQLERLQADCLKDTGKLVELPEEYNAKGVKKEEIKAAIYKFS